MKEEHELELEPPGWSEPESRKVSRCLQTPSCLRMCEEGEEREEEEVRLEEEAELKSKSNHVNDGSELLKGLSDRLDKNGKHDSVDKSEDDGGRQWRAERLSCLNLRLVEEESSTTKKEGGIGSVLPRAVMEEFTPSPRSAQCCQNDSVPNRTTGSC